MFPGFNKAKRSTISSGDWDRDGVTNRKDYNAMNWKKQEGGEPFVNEERDLKSAIEINRRRIKVTDNEEERAHLEKINSGFDDRIAKGRIEIGRLKMAGRL